jgi:glycosyltransferase involved in cell wall biosynthesis
VENAPLVSIVMPTYNGSRYIDQAIQSCIEQTYVNWELIIVDDASTDNTPSIIERFVDQDPRIYSIRHAQNRKLPGALNTGFRQAHGEYFTWFSDDDLYLPNAIQEMVTFLEENPDVGLTYTDFTFIDAEGQPLETISVEPPETIGIHNPTGLCHLYRRCVQDAVGDYAEDLFLVEDLDFWIRAFSKFKVKPLHKNLAYYRQHGASLTGTRGRCVYPLHEEVLRRHLPTMHWMNNEMSAYAYLRLAKKAVLGRDVARAAKYTVKAARFSPSYVIKKSFGKFIAREPQSPTQLEQASVSPTMPHVVWLYTQNPNETLDSATWLETTQELRKLGWKVTLVTPGQQGIQQVRGIETLGIPRPNWYLLGQMKFHADFVRLLNRQSEDVDVVLFHPLSALWLMPLRYLRVFNRKRKPLFVMDSRTLHMTREDKQSFKDKLRKHFYGLMHHLANHWTDGQVAITSRLAKAVGIPQKRLWGVWSSGVNAERFASVQVYRKWNITGEPIRLVYVGSLNYERNLMALCRAVKRANDEGLCFSLIIVGEGTEKADLEKFASTTYGQIYVFPAVPHEQVPHVLAQAHVGVLPFPDEEKFRVSSAIKLFEYMASGLPIMSTRIVAHTDVVGEGQCAFWADDASEQGLLGALKQIWCAQESLAEMGTQASLAVEDWTWAASAQKLKTALEKGLAEQQR